jgi:hypothetical protein
VQPLILTAAKDGIGLKEAALRAGPVLFLQPDFAASAPALPW